MRAIRSAGDDRQDRPPAARTWCEPPGRRRRAAVTFLVAWSLAAAGVPFATAVAADPTFTVSADPAVVPVYTGRVYVLFAQRAPREPRFGPSWFGTEPFAAVDVDGWDPATGPIEVGGPGTLWYPPDAAERAARFAAGAWRAQAVVRLNRDSSHLGSGDGNAYSAVWQGAPGALGPHADGDATAATPTVLHVDRLVEPPAAPDDPDVHVVEIRSEALSAFHGRTVLLRASVILPPGTTAMLRANAGDDAAHGAANGAANGAAAAITPPDAPAAAPVRPIPANYWIGGFGSTHRVARREIAAWRRTPHSGAMARIVLDPDCFGGHHVFADSANNGPWGTALVHELIPALEACFPLRADRDARLLSGHSSGGWTVLWLMLTHPETFGGCWSSAPDPVDFHAFQLVDIHAAEANMYRAADGTRLTIGHNRGRPLLYADDFIAMENVLGEGGQIRSFEWVFSPRGADGLPRPLFDRATGRIDPDVADAWRAWDIHAVLRERWNALAPLIAGRMHIYAGGQDTFHLERAVMRLDQTVRAEGWDLPVRIYEGADHGSFMRPDLIAEIQQSMLDVARGTRAGDATTPQRIPSEAGD